MKSSKIEWTESTWNPITGCTKISEGCLNCYAERMALRLQAMGQQNYKDGFKVRWHEKMLKTPLTWKKSRMIFVNSMSDLFHEEVPVSFVNKIISTIKEANWHVFQVLTKRSKRLVEFSESTKWPSNLWLGVTVESKNHLDRIEDLKSINAKCKFISFEPLLSEIPDINLEGIDWVIVGGESGPGAREMKREWVLEIKEMCEKRKIPFFFKQWGGVNKKKTGRILLDKTWDQYPDYAYIY